MTDPPLPPAVQQMLDATNQGDNDSFLASFADDAVLDDWGREFVGTAAIAGWNDRENIGTQSRILVHDATPTNDGVTLSISVSGNGYNGGGSFRFVTREGLIARLTIRG